MILYNLFIFFSTRDKNFIYYVICLISFMPFQLSINGFNNEIWTNFLNGSNSSLLSFGALYLLTLLWFSKNYLHTNLYAPKINIFFICLIVISTILILLTLVPIFSYSLIAIIGGWFCILIAFTIFVTSILILKKHPPTQYFILAIFMMLLGLITRPLMSAGILSYNIFTINAMQIGSAFEFLLFSLGLGYKIKLLQQEKSMAQQKINEELSRLNQLKDNFLANTSHELRTPLHGIIGISESIIDGVAEKVSDTVKQNLSYVIFNAKRLSFLVNDLLDMSRLKHKDIVLKKKSLDLFTVANIVLSISKHLIKNKPVTLINHIAPNAHAVFADEDRLQQIIQNLVGNAVKFTQKGKIEISAQKIGDWIEISISDTGKGIAEHKQAEIFKSFEQAGEHGGTGLGLSITKKLIELHGGAIRVASAIDQGSTFTFTMPMAQTPVTQITTPTITESFANEDLNAHHDIQLDDAAGTILIVDDEPINIQIVKNHLSPYHYNLVECASGMEALEYLEKNTLPELVLLDVMMPVMDGFDVCSKIRNKYSRLDLPVIYLTARNQVTDLVQGFESGGNDYLVKPFSKSELLSRIQNQFSIRNIKNRMVNLTAYSNKIGEFVNIQILIQKLCTHLTNDPCFRFAGGFHEDQLIDCRPFEYKALKKAYQKWNATDEMMNTADGCFLFIQLNMYVIVIQVHNDLNPIDHAYAKSLVDQTHIMHANIQKLVSNPKTLQDLSYIITNLKNITHLQLDDGYVFAYNGNTNHMLNLSLKNLKFFYDDSEFIQISRTCLVKTSCINSIIKETRDKKRPRYHITVKDEKLPIGRYFIPKLKNKFPLKTIHLSLA